MENSVSILEKFYTILNVASLTDVITGEVFMSDKPKDREVEDVVINVLSNPDVRITERASARLSLVDGYVNVNIFCKATKSDTPDTLRFKTLTPIVVGLIDEQYKEGIYLSVESDNIFRDTGNSNMFYNNLRINFQIH